MNNIPMMYAHLPTNLEEYEKIINCIEDGISVKELDHKISIAKGTDKEYHHYRSILKRLGLIMIKGKVVLVPKLLEEYQDDSFTPQELLKYVCYQNEEVITLFRMINSVVGFNYEIPSKHISLIVEQIKDVYNIRRPKDLRRVLRPIVILGELVGAIPEDDGYAYFLRLSQQIVTENVEWGESFPLKKLEEELLHREKGFETLGFNHYIKKMYEDSYLRYKIAFITFPDWSTVFKGIDLKGEYYTHLKLYKPLLVEGV